MFFSKRAFNALSSSSRCSGDNSFLLLLMFFILLLQTHRLTGGYLPPTARIRAGQWTAFDESESRRSAEGLRAVHSGAASKFGTSMMTNPRGIPSSRRMGRHAPAVFRFGPTDTRVPVRGESRPAPATSCPQPAGLPHKPDQQPLRLRHRLGQQPHGSEM